MCAYYIGWIQCAAWIILDFLSTSDCHGEGTLRDELVVWELAGGADGLTLDDFYFLFNLCDHDFNFFETLNEEFFR